MRYKIPVSSLSAFIKGFFFLNHKTKCICFSFIDRFIACISVNDALAKMEAGWPITCSDINYS